MLTLAEVDFPGLLWNHSMPGLDRESPLWTCPLKNSQGNPELGIKLSPTTTDAFGFTSEDYLCLSITLAPAKDGYIRDMGSALCFRCSLGGHQPHDCASSELFSNTCRSTYAVLGFTRPTGSIRSLQFVVDRLFSNDYRSLTLHSPSTRPPLAPTHPYSPLPYSTPLHSTPLHCAEGTYPSRHRYSVLQVALQ